MVVGVIGGAGVAATNKLCELLEIRKTKEGAFRDCHHPEMIIFQATQAPSRSMFLEGKGPSFIEDYINVAEKLQHAGAERLCMCCNTAHYALPVIEKSVSIPFINMIEEVVIRCENSRKKRFGLVASDGCLKGGVYEKYFETIFPEAQLIYPDQEFQKMVTKGICNVKNTHRFDDVDSEERPRHIFDKVYQHLMDKGAEVVIMGCTDIRVDYVPEKPNIIDSLETLSNAIYQLSL